MSFEELLPTLKEQSYFAVMRYDKRRDDKLQELVAMSYEKFISDKEKGVDASKQIYKQFISKRSRELDLRSVAKKGFGGVSTRDALGFYRRRNDSVSEFQEWDCFDGNARNVENNYNFQLDLKTFLKKLKKIELEIFNLKALGLTFKEIAKKLQLSVSKVFTALTEIKEKFIKYFELKHACA